MLNNSMAVKHCHEPYQFFVIDNLLDKDTFSRLRKEYGQVAESIKSWHLEFGIEYSSNKSLDKPIQIYGGTSTEDSYTDICNKFKGKKSSLRFFTQLLDKKFLQKIFGNDVLPKNVKIWHPSKKIGLFDKIFHDNLTVSLKMSRLNPGAGIAIHPDNYPKRVSMLLYIGWSDSIHREIGGTQIYEINEDFDCPHHQFFKHKNFKLVENVSPTPNRLMGFVATKNSWHGVDPYTTKDLAEITRDTLQINLVKHTKYSKFVNLIAKLKMILNGN